MHTTTYSLPLLVQREVTPKLSVTVLNYNYGRFLPTCLDSILAQTFEDFEVVVIDDCSSDASLEAVKPYLSDSRVRLIKHSENMGATYSLIEGTEVHSRGEFITVMSADDIVLSPDAFSRQIALLRAREGISLCFTSFIRFDSDTGERRDTYRCFEEDVILDREVAFRESISGPMGRMLHSGTIVRKEAYDRCGGYRRNFRFAHDFSLWPLLSLEGDVAYCADALYGYRTHRQQMSHTLAVGRIFQRELLEAIDMACDAADRRGLDTRSLRTEAIRYNLSIMALDDAFNDRARLALSRALAAVMLRPTDALLLRALWTVPARVILGERAFGYVRALMPRRCRCGDGRP